MNLMMLGIIAGGGFYGSATPPPDAPTSWGPLDPQYLNANNNWSLAYKMDNSRDGTWIATTNSLNILRSVNNGTIWSPLPDGLGSGFSMIGVATDRNGVWCVGGQAGKVFRSTDDGLNWTSLPDGFGGTASSVSHFATDLNGVWIAVLNGGYAYRSTDNAATWSALPNGLNSGTTSGNAPIVVTDKNGTWMYATGNGYASVSTDNGETWMAMTRNLDPLDTSNSVIYTFATNGNGTWISGKNNGTLCRTTDNGDTWETISGASGIPPVVCYEIVHDEGQVFAAVYGSGYAAYTEDSGDSWTQITRGLNNNGSASLSIYALDTDGAGRWIALMGGGRASISPPI